MNNITNLFPLASPELFILSGDLSTNSVLAEQLTMINKGKPIMVRQAKRVITNDQVIITGITTLFANGVSYIVTIHGYYNQQGVVEVNASFNMSDGTQYNLNFSDIFTTLPYFSLDQSTAYLAQLNIINSSFILSTCEGTFFNKKCEAAFNYYGSCQINELIPSLKFDFSTPISVNGYIIAPTDHAVPARIYFANQPWQMENKAPGIYLCAELPVVPFEDDLNIDNVCFRFYSPISETWCQDNNTYHPVSALCCVIDIPSADNKVSVECLNPCSLTDITFYGICNNFIISDLAQLGSVTNDADLIEYLPTNIKNQFEKLPNLSLYMLSVQIYQGKINNIGLMVGCQNINANILGNVDLSLGSVSFMLNPVHGTTVVTLDGEITLFDASFDISFDPSNKIMNGSLKKQTSLPLNNLLPQLPDFISSRSLDIDSLELCATDSDSTKSMEFSGGLAAVPGWTIELGPAPQLTIESIGLMVDVNSTASFCGLLTISEAIKLYIRYDYPGDMLLTGQLPNVSLRDLTDALVNQPLSLPDDFNPTFDDCQIAIDYHADSCVLQLTSVTEDLGPLSIQIQKNGAQWGIAVGIELETQYSTLPSLNIVKQFNEIFNFNQFTVVVSSFKDEHFIFPTIPDQNGVNKEITIPNDGSLLTGLNLYTKADFKSTSPNGRLLDKFLDFGSEFDIVLQIGGESKDQTMLYSSYKTSIKGHPLNCDFGAHLKNESLSLFLHGTMSVNIQNSPQDFSVTMDFVENGAFLSGSMLGADAVQYSVFQLNDLALEVGIDLEGIPSVGVMATIVDDSFESSVALFFDSADPAKSLIAGALGDLSADQVLDCFVGNKGHSHIDSLLVHISIAGTNEFSISSSNATDLDNRDINKIIDICNSEGDLQLPTTPQDVSLIVKTTGEKWYLTDMANMRHYTLTKTGNNIIVETQAQLYCAPQPTLIANKTLPEGFYVNGKLTFFGFELIASIDIEPNQGISIIADMGQINIGPDDQFVLIEKPGNDGPELSLSTYFRPNISQPDYVPPHFSISGELNLLGLQESITANATDNGFNFDLTGELLSLIVFDLGGLFNEIHGVTIEGKLLIEYDQSINCFGYGIAHFKGTVECPITINIDANLAEAVISIKFTFAGNPASIGPKTLDIDNNFFNKIYDIVIDYIATYIGNELSNYKKWVEYIQKGLITGVKSIVEVCKELYHLDYKTATTVMKELGDSSTESAIALRSIYGCNPLDATKALKLAGYTANDTAIALKMGYAIMFSNMAGSFLHDAGYTNTETAYAMKTIYGASAETVADFLKEICGLGEDTIDAILHVLKYPASTISNVLKKLFGWVPSIYK